jgi:hypothetical protein
MDTATMIRRDIVIEVAKALFISSFKANEDGSAAVANPASCIDAAELWATAQIGYCRRVESDSE